MPTFEELPITIKYGGAQMVSQTTLERLRTFRISGLIDELVRQNETSQYQDLSFDDRLTLLVDAEHTRRIDQQTKRMLKNARIPSSADLDQVDFAAKRGLQKKMFLELIQGAWIQRGTNIIITGPTGIGKTFLASVLSQSLCMRGKSVKFQRTHHWLTDLLLVEERKRLSQTIASYRKLSLIAFDEWLRDTVSTPEARLLLDLLDDRYSCRSCMFVSQIPVAAWHERFHDPTIGDAILDRIVHNAVRIELDGESMRKLKAADGDIAAAGLGGGTSLRSDNIVESTNM